MRSNSERPISIFTLLYRHSPKLLTLASVLGAVAGALYSLIIPFVLSTLQGQTSPTLGSDHKFVAINVGPEIYFLVCTLILICKVFSIILVNNIAKSATGELRIKIANQVSNMSTNSMEAQGFSRLLNILIDDVNMVANAAITVPMLMVSAVTVVGMMTYLATLNMTVFIISVIAIIFGILMFQIPLSIAGKNYNQARSIRDAIQEGIRGLIHGVYELKLNRKKSERYLDEEISQTQRESIRLEKIGDAMIHLAGNASELLSFFVIGLVVFILPKYVSVPSSQTVGVVMAMLYITAPIAAILSMLRQLQLGSVAITRIQNLRGELEEIKIDTVVPEITNWNRFGVRAVSYQYSALQADTVNPESPTASPSEKTFALAPVSLEFHRAQINFIVGGNGSGKSTLSKLLSLHYKPQTGMVFFDELVIDASNLDAARSRISVIFSNYYLFRKLYRSITPEDEQLIGLWLNKLALTGKTELVDKQFTTIKLSDGQRRRLALLVALLEDRDIYIFDEWAADQDPAFKQLFYCDILQDLKRRNKLVIVITHDDRYFDCADRLIMMESGRITEVRDLSIPISHHLDSPATNKAENRFCESAT